MRHGPCACAFPECCDSQAGQLPPTRNLLAAQQAVCLAPAADLGSCSEAGQPEDPHGHQEAQDSAAEPAVLSRVAMPPHAGRTFCHAMQHMTPSFTILTHQTVFDCELVKGNAGITQLGTS